MAVLLGVGGVDEDQQFGVGARGEVEPTDADRRRGVGGGSGAGPGRVGQKRSDPLPRGRGGLGEVALEQVRADAGRPPAAGVGAPRDRGRAVGPGEDRLGPLGVELDAVEPAGDRGGGVELDRVGRGEVVHQPAAEELVEVGGLLFVPTGPRVEVAHQAVGDDVAPGRDVVPQPIDRGPVERPGVGQHDQCESLGAARLAEAGFVDDFDLQVQVVEQAESAADRVGVALGVAGVLGVFAVAEGEAVEDRGLGPQQADPCRGGLGLLKQSAVAVHEVGGPGDGVEPGGGAIFLVQEHPFADFAAFTSAVEGPEHDRLGAAADALPHPVGDVGGCRAAGHESAEGGGPALELGHPEPLVLPGRAAAEHAEQTDGLGVAGFAQAGRMPDRVGRASDEVDHVRDLPNRLPLVEHAVAQAVRVEVDRVSAVTLADDPGKARHRGGHIVGAEPPPVDPLDVRGDGHLGVLLVVGRLDLIKGLVLAVVPIVERFDRSVKTLEKRVEPLGGARRGPDHHARLVPHNPRVQRGVVGVAIHQPPQVLLGRGREVRVPRVHHFLACDAAPHPPGRAGAEGGGHHAQSATLALIEDRVEGLEVPHVPGRLDQVPEREDPYEFEPGIRHLVDPAAQLLGRVGAVDKQFAAKKRKGHGRSSGVRRKGIEPRGSDGGATGSQGVKSGLIRACDGPSGAGHDARGIKRPQTLATAAPRRRG